MTDTGTSKGLIRKLWMRERDKLCDHLLRLDVESRRLRFAHGVSDAFIKEYVAKINDLNSVVYGYFDGADMRAAAELRKIGTTWGKNAEGAFSVERGYQNAGIGSELMGRVIRAARNRAVHHLQMACLAENSKMQHVARKHSAVLRYSQGEMTGEIEPEPGNFSTMLEEAADDQRAYMLMILDLQTKLLPSAVA
jgi:GNAT superfamily N-acetyltransferase